MKTESKLIEVRDHATCIPVLAIRFEEDGAPEDWLLRRAGFRECPGLLVVHLSSGKGYTDPYHGDYSGQRTMPVAHQALDENWDFYKTDDVLDVRVVLKETTAPVRSERGNYD